MFINNLKFSLIQANPSEVTKVSAATRLMADDVRADWVTVSGLGASGIVA